jgi:cysteine--1-D-myo-inosityl 2-amino-2-deoxy-alpha-D-glucopyranoside ligase
MYVCGITPYDATHLGHAATYLTFDLIHRLWLDLGYQVHYVQNITDVDDPLFERANRDGIDWRDLAVREVALYREDMAALRVLPPREYVAATEAVAEVVELVEKMLASGAAYIVDDAEFPDVYFRADATSEFGYESGYDRDTMLTLFAERGGDPDRAGKTDQLDALLWRAERPGEPSWPSPFGPGRPGWHVECAAIALSRIGSTLDIQGGGSDLIFPHHEFTAAHAESVSGERRFARHYVHAGMIGWDGHKMSKSRGNLVLRASSRRPSGWACWPGTTAPTGTGAHRCWKTQARGCSGGGPRPHCPRARTPPTSSPGCADIWPTISIRPKRLPHLMVGLRTHWSTAATTARRHAWWRRSWMRCWEWNCRQRGSNR